MTARTHDLGALAALLAVSVSIALPPLTLGTVIGALLANQIGGIIPDIDQPTAPFWRNLPIGKIFGKVTGKMLGGHRFLTHSILGVALLGGLSNLLLKFLHPLMPKVDNTVVWWAFIIGIVSHLVLDTFTKEGVPWLLPLPLKFGLPPIKRLRVTTGSMAEKLVFIALAAFVIWLVSHHYDYLLLTLKHLS